MEKSTSRPAKDVVTLALPTPFALGDVNVYLLEGECLTLVDTGPRTKVAWNALVQGVEGAGYRVSDIKQLVLTHYHEDHSGWAARLRDEYGVQVLAHPDTAVWLSGTDEFREYRTQFFTDLYRQAGMQGDRIIREMKLFDELDKLGCVCPIDTELHNGDVLSNQEEWRVLYTPGHSQTHLSLYREDDHTMIFGDHVIGHISSNAFVEPNVKPGGERVKTLIQYRNEMKKLLDLQIAIGLSGHGEAIFDHAKLIQKRLDSQERRAHAILELLTVPKSTFALASELFPNHLDQIPLILSETLGFLEWMEEEGRVEGTFDEDIKLWQKAQSDTIGRT